MPNIRVPAAGEAVPSKSTVFLAMTPKLRVQLATTIENLIALLDEVDGDVDLEDDEREHDTVDDEDGHDREPTMGAGNSIDQTHAYRGSSRPDECEEENEHGGDVLDEPHDQVDQGDDEPSMGWTEKMGQDGVGLGDMEAADFELLDPYQCATGFTGKGHDEARQMLGQQVYRRHHMHEPEVSVLCLRR
jgi:hypothetical protein